MAFARFYEGIFLASLPPSVLFVIFSGHENKCSLINYDLFIRMDRGNDAIEWKWTEGCSDDLLAKIARMCHHHIENNNLHGDLLSLLQ